VKLVHLVGFITKKFVTPTAPNHHFTKITMMNIMASPVKISLRKF